MPMGTMSVTVEQSGFKADQRRVALSAAQPDVSVNTRLEREAPAGAATTAGVLVVDSRPAGARVLMDGRHIGVTPLSLPGVLPGTHSIRLELAGFNPWVTTADVTAGSRTRVAASLEQRGTPE